MLIKISGSNLKIKNIKKDLNGVSRKLLNTILAKNMVGNQKKIFIKN